MEKNILSRRAGTQDDSLRLPGRDAAGNDRKRRGLKSLKGLKGVKGGWVNVVVFWGWYNDALLVGELL